MFRDRNEDQIPGGAWQKGRSGIEGRNAWSVRDIMNIEADKCKCPFEVYLRSMME